MVRPLALAGLLGLGLAFGAVLVLIAPAPPRHQAIEWLDNPRAVGGFRLRDVVGDVDRQSLAGRWTIVVFGFLHCPDICPTSLAQMAALAESLAGSAEGASVRYVFVSVDPGRDSVQEIERYVRHFGSGIRGLTGNPPQLERFADDLGIQFDVSADTDDYAVAHSSTFSIIGPDGSLRGRFRHGFHVPAVAAGLTTVIREHSNSRVGDTL